MAKIKLGARPKSFKRIVKFPMLEGGEGSIEVTYKYRTRKEFGAFIDEWRDAAVAEGEKPVDPDAKFSLSDLYAKTAGSNAEYVLKIAEGWNLDEDFTAANVQQLADEVPAAVAAIMEAYQAAITEGRLGN